MAGASLLKQFESPTTKKDTKQQAQKRWKEEKRAFKQMMKDDEQRQALLALQHQMLGIQESKKVGSNACNEDQNRSKQDPAPQQHLDCVENAELEDGELAPQEQQPPPAQAPSLVPGTSQAVVVLTWFSSCRLVEHTKSLQKQQEDADLKLKDADAAVKSAADMQRTLDKGIKSAEQGIAAEEAREREIERLIQALEAEKRDCAKKRKRFEDQKADFVAKKQENDREYDRQSTAAKRAKKELTDVVEKLEKVKQHNESTIQLLAGGSSCSSASSAASYAPPAAA